MPVRTLTVWGWVSPQRLAQDLEWELGQASAQTMDRPGLVLALVRATATRVWEPGPAQVGAIMARESVQELDRAAEVEDRVLAPDQAPVSVTETVSGLVLPELALVPELALALAALVVRDRPTHADHMALKRLHKCA